MLSLVTHLGDAFRAWSVPGAFLSILLIAPVAWQLGGLLVARALSRHGWQQAAAMMHVGGSLDESIRRPGPRFVTLVAALIFMVAIMIAGAAVPLSRVGWAEQGVSDMLAYADMAGADRAFWNGLLAFSWALWATGCWAVAIAFSPRPAAMTLASVAMWWAAFFATAHIGAPIL